MCWPSSSSASRRATVPSLRFGFSQLAVCRQTHITAVCRIHRCAGWDAAAHRQEEGRARVTLSARRKHEKHGAIPMPAARAARRAVLGAANDEHGRNDGVFRGECGGSAASRPESVAGYVWTGMIRVAPDGLCADEGNAHGPAVRGPRLLPRDLLPRDPASASPQHATCLGQRQRVSALAQQPHTHCLSLASLLAS